MKSVVVTLSNSVPDEALSKDATITIEGVQYSGKVTAILTHPNILESEVTLRAIGLKTA